MHDYLFSSEIVRFAFVFGVVVSMTLYERLHLTTGSIVVPGYIAIFLVYPLVVAATFVNALFSYWVVNNVVRKRFMLYGRTKFTVMALISISVQGLMLKLTPQGRWLWEDEIPLFVGAGYVVPALIAHDMGRQGVMRTCKAVMLAGIIVATPIAIALLVDLNGVNDLAPLKGFGTMSIVSRWVPVAVLLSALASWAVTANYRLKSGGFVGAAYIGMFMGDPYQVAAALIVAFVTFLVVRGVLMRWLILFGRRKFAAMLLTSSLISWTLLWTGTRLFSATVTSHLDLASLALTPLFVPGLLANDMDRTSPPKLVLGVAMAAGFVVPTTWWVQSLVEHRPLPLVWRLVSVIMTVVVFHRQLVALAARAARPPLRWAPAVRHRLLRPLGQPLRALLLVRGRQALPSPPSLRSTALAGATHLQRRGEPFPAIALSTVEAADPLVLAAAQAQFDAEVLFSWSVTGLERWMEEHSELAAEAERWLQGQLYATDPLEAAWDAQRPGANPGPSWQYV